MPKKAKNVHLITERVEDDIRYEFDGVGLGDLLIKVQGLIDEHGTNAMLYIDMSQRPYEEHEFIDMYIDKSRPETDEEKKNRVLNEVAHQSANENRERAELERLSKKYS